MNAARVACSRTRRAALKHPTALEHPSRATAWAVRSTQYRVTHQLAHRNPGGSMSVALSVVDAGHTLTFTVDDMNLYHGPGYPGGVAHAAKVLERALPLLDAGRVPERRAITITTAFRGPGARDAFEMVTRAVTEDRYVVDPALERPDRGRVLERYVFRLGYRGQGITLLLREGYVVPEFIDLARQEQRTVAEEERLTVLKAEMATRLLARPAAEVYDVE